MLPSVSKDCHRKASVAGKKNRPVTSTELQEEEFGKVCPAKVGNTVGQLPKAAL